MHLHWATTPFVPNSTDSPPPTHAPSCAAEITAFSDRYEEFSKLNTEVLGVSVDSVVCISCITLLRRNVRGNPTLTGPKAGTAHACRWRPPFLYEKGEMKVKGVARLLERDMVLFVHLSLPQFSHLAWIQTDRKAGGLGDLAYPLVADITKSISKAFNVLIEDDVSDTEAWQWTVLLRTVQRKKAQNERRAEVSAQVAPACASEQCRSTTARPYERKGSSSVLGSVAGDTLGACSKMCWCNEKADSETLLPACHRALLSAGSSSLTRRESSRAAPSTTWPSAAALTRPSVPSRYG